MSVECPNCDAPLPATGGCTRCDWMPTPPPHARATFCAVCQGNDPGCPVCCSTCFAIRAANKRKQEYRVAAHCDRCGDHSPSVSEFHPGEESADPDDCGKRLCPACWITSLRRRAERDPITGAQRAELPTLLARLGALFTMPVPAATFFVPDATSPTCAGCGTPAAEAISRDGRLWHERCWDGLRDRVARARARR